MNNKKNKWIIPVIAIAVVAIMITCSIITIRFIRQTFEEVSVAAAQDLNQALTEDEHDDDDNATQEESSDDTVDDNATQEESSEETSETDLADISDIYGGWESDAYYEFREDGTYGWYKSSEDLSDNYYSGSISVLKGAEACEHLGITLDKVLTVMVNSEGTVGINDIYCITCSPTYLVSSGVDKSDTLKGISYDLLFVVTGEKSAQATNMGNYDTYYFTKIR